MGTHGAVRPSQRVCGTTSFPRKREETTISQCSCQKFSQQAPRNRPTLDYPLRHRSCPVGLQPNRQGPLW
jgi:hypothetical protein